MAAVWPPGLPYIASRQVYAVQALGQAPMTSPVQSGKIRQRPQFTLRIAQVAYGWEFKSADLGTFRSFLNDTLGEGTAEFTLPTWIEPINAYQDRIVQIRGGASGINERKIGFARTLVSCVLNIRNF